ncbi:pimeloyl-ACP methyl ester carboxylesterase [Breoghania corrubedonensis]|uniref:Pimeloyl-ACP methyl ester carboxylesterase n=1 Tax=Breoghania corrubedonensis TaxID=665038 RepID=A0A2T5V5X2_9HYPH|nr:alpha/beta fold hydrolase [Breoghania corrubedonensis]PTW59157.1 pimeloyl-ACP methyl ester carboxylesterase [Breoghania corrubedonensis]
MEPLVLVPGLLCTEILFAPQIGAFSDHPVMVADNRNHDSIAAMAAEILERAPERFAIAGLSMGGYVAMEVIRMAQERVSRLALLNTVARPDAPEQTENRRRLMRLAADSKFDSIAPALFTSLVPPARQNDQELRNAIFEMARDTGPDAFVRQEEAIIARIDQRPNLGAIACPTLVLAGADDPLMPVDVVREIHEGIPASRFEIVPACGHLSTLERPDAVTALLKTWMDG